jgi:DNA-binding CsgD family transcriptional regulator
MMLPKLTHHDIYDAALNDELFRTLPAQLARDIDVPSALFFWLHPGEVREISAGTQPEANRYYDDFMDNDPWMAHVDQAKAGIGAMRLTDYVSPQDFEKSAMYNEFIVENRLERYWCLGLVQNTLDGMVITALHKGKKAGDFSDDEMSYINRHAADLGRLHTIRRELLRNRIEEATAADNTLLDQVPIFELDHEGKILRMNGCAEALHQLHPSLIIKFDRTLTLHGAKAEVLSRAITAATGADNAQADMICLPQVRGTDGRIIPKIRLNFLPRNVGGRRVLIILTTENETGLDEVLLRPEETIQLTSRERDVLYGLIHGRRRDQIAHDLGVAVPTVDLHSTNLRRKLGARTIAEAVAIAIKWGAT